MLNIQKLINNKVVNVEENLGGRGLMSLVHFEDGTTLCFESESPIIVTTYNDYDENAEEEYD